MWNLFERIVLLASGFRGQLEEPFFGVKSVADACLQFLLYIIATTHDVQAVRKVYQTVLFQSSLTRSMSESDSVYYKALIDASIEFEQSSGDDGTRERLLRLFDAAIKIFNGTADSADYHQRRDDEVLYG